MNTFEASNGITVRRASKGYLTFATDIDLGLFTGISVDQEAALRELFRHERDEERGMWRSAKDRTWTAVRRNGIVYFQNEDHERNFWFIVEDPATLKPWSHDLQQVAREYIDAHPERKPWEDAKTGEAWVLEVPAGPVVAVRRFDGGFYDYEGNRLTMKRVSEARRIYPEGEAS